MLELARASASALGFPACILRKEAYQLSPGVLTELLSICASLGLAPFSSPEARQSLADIAQNYYLKRGSGGLAIKCKDATTQPR